MTNKLKYFVGNWKMFGNLSSIKIIYEISRFCKHFKTNNKPNKIVFCVPNTLINFFKTKLKTNLVNIGAQNCHFNETPGPFTGSINSSMLKDAGAKYIILGHSDNRSDGETDEIIKKKVKSALNQNLNVIFCIGETFKEKKNKKTFLVLKKQIIKGIDKNFDLNKIIIAYEPIWSIGTGKIPKISDLTKTFSFIKITVKKYFKTNKEPSILYGGSVNSKNINMFAPLSNLDGFLIGGASQSAKNFIDILKNYYK